VKILKFYREEKPSFIGRKRNRMENTKKKEKDFLVSFPSEKVFLDISDPKNLVFLIKDERKNLKLLVSSDELLKIIREKFEDVFLEERYKGMQEMLAFIIHEIKNPFFALKNAILSSQIKDENMKIIKSLLLRIETIIDNVTIFIKGREIVGNPENIESIIEDAISEIEELKGYVFHYDFEIKREYNSDRVFVIGDRFLLKRAFLNIITNSAESLENSKEKKILVRTTDTEDGFIKCEIEDSGCGIPPENLNKIFIPFFTTKPKGMGLGMSTAKKIIELHKGKIEIKSEQNKGTQVSILIPSAQKNSLFSNHPKTETK
jgi:signal transduction histidine kinase